MDQEHKPLSLFVPQKTPESAGQKPPPTSADVKAKLMEVLDNLNNVSAVSALTKALRGEQEPPQKYCQDWLSAQQGTADLTI